MKKVLAINSGSSSFKFKLFAVDDEQVLAKGLADRVGMTSSTFTTKLSDGTKHVQEVSIPDQETAVKLLVENLKKYNLIKDPNEIAGVGHRIVAGGENFKESTIITKDNLPEIYDLAEYAPLHNVPEANGIKAFMKVLPKAVQVGVFDSAFHQTMDPVHYLYAVPYKYYVKYKARKYGAHGTSVRYVVARTAELLQQKANDLKIIVCHLGSGASITAVKNGKSFDTSMGFSPVAGIAMSTRSGDVDPSLLEYIMEKEHLNMEQVIDILNHQSGLLGISEISPDMRLLREDYKDRSSAQLARKIFINRIIRYIGAYIAEMGGCDAIVFTAGVGEHDVGVRAAIMNAFAYLGVKADAPANEKGGERIISAEGSSIKVMVVPTDEELMIERDVVRLGNLK